MKIFLEKNDTMFIIKNANSVGEEIMKKQVLEQGTFFTGVNYWASHAGTRMWSDWRPDIIEEDFKQLASANISVLRVFPLWPEFQPLRQLTQYQSKLKELALREEFLDLTTEEGRAGVDPEAIEKFAEFCRLATKYGLKLLVPLITGYMSGRSFVPEAFVGKNVLTDPMCIKWEKRFIQYFVKRFKNEECIIAWELGNECNCLNEIDSEEQAWLWTSSLVDAAKREDPDRPFISGMHSLQCGGFTIPDQGEICDMLTVHPYPLFTAHCAMDPLVSPRAIGHIPAEQTFYSDLGERPCLVEEIGTLGNIMGDEGQKAKAVRAGLFNTWAHDGRGYMWWCAYDQIQLMFAPYDWHEVERELGMFKLDRSEKLVAEEYRKFNKFLKEFPYETLPARRRHAVCVLPTAFAWDISFGAFMIAKRAGFELKFAERNIPANEKLYIVPAGKSNDVLLKRYMVKLLEYVENGSTLMITYNGSMMSPFDNITGCRSLGRYEAAEGDVVFEDEVFKFKKRYELDLVPEKAEVIARDSKGKPAFVCNKRGKGQILFLNAPLENQIVTTPGAPSGEVGFEKFYRYAAKVAGITSPIVKKNPHIDITIHDVDEKHAIVVALNNMDADIDDIVTLNGASFGEVHYGNVKASGDTVRLKIGAADAAVFTINF